MQSSLTVHTFPNAVEMGKAAAQRAASRIRDLADTLECVPVVFATGVSQLETLRSLVRTEDVPWAKVVGFHLDEYLGIGPEHPASFRRYLKNELTALVPFRKFHWIDADAGDALRVCEEYAAALRIYPPVLCLLGIGENGHLAFNDPAEADFSDPVDVKRVQLDRECRQQQVNEGWFATLEQVPAQAVTLTIPAIMRIPELIVSVPGARKSAVVARTLFEEISTGCPSTILRTHPNVHLYLDAESSRELHRK